MRRPGWILIVLLFTVYAADGVASKWTYQCTSGKSGEFHLNPTPPAELEGKPDARVINPERPPGCTLTSQNMLRRFYDRVVL